MKCYVTTCVTHSWRTWKMCENEGGMYGNGDALRIKQSMTRKKQFFFKSEIPKVILEGFLKCFFSQTVDQRRFQTWESLGLIEKLVKNHLEHFFKRLFFGRNDIKDLSLLFLNPFLLSDPLAKQQLWAHLA